jgi:hypothetical protein
MGIKLKLSEIVLFISISNPSVILSPSNGSITET